jgi:predicted nucleic acid-binding protein
VRCFHEEIAPSVRIEWVDELTHGVGVSVLLSIGKRGLSLVDCVSFVVMERLRIKDVFTFDPHFRERGFECRP